MEKPEDACIKDNGETYEIQPEKEGTTLDTKKVQKVIRAAVSAGDTTVNLEKKTATRNLLYTKMIKPSRKTAIR